MLYYNAFGFYDQGRFIFNGTITDDVAFRYTTYGYFKNGVTPANHGLRLTNLSSDNSDINVYIDNNPSLQSTIYIAILNPLIIA